MQLPRYQSQLHEHRQQHSRCTRRLLICLGVCIMLLSYPHLAYKISLTRICSISCLANRLFRDPRLPRVDRCNDTDTAKLLDGFGLTPTGLNLTTPIYVWLTKPRPPVDIAGISCLAKAVSEDGRHAKEGVPVAKDACFKMRYSIEDKTMVYPVLYRLQQNFTQRGLEIFLSDGSLLGSQRHFGIIPWDDDIDFLVLRDQKFELHQLLVELSFEDEFCFYDEESITRHWRLGLQCQPDRTKPAQPRYGMSRRFPVKNCKFAVDLFFAEIYGDEVLRLEQPYRMNKRDVYPIQLLPFGPRLMRAPANPIRVLEAIYGWDYELRCKFEPHTNEFPCSRKFLECDKLRRDYPFVRYTELQLGGRSFFADILVLRGQTLAIFIPAQMLRP